MENIKEYIYSFMIISVVAGIINTLAPDSGNVKKNIRFIVSLCVVLILLLPFKSIVYDLPKLLNYNINDTDKDIDYSSYENIIVEAAEEKIKETIYKAVKSKFGIKNFTVELELDSSDIENIEITKIKIILQTKNKYMISDVSNYVKSLMQCETEVTYNE